MPEEDRNQGTLAAICHAQALLHSNNIMLETSPVLFMAVRAKSMEFHRAMRGHFTVHHSSVFSNKSYVQKTRTEGPQVPVCGTDDV